MECNQDSFMQLKLCHLEMIVHAWNPNTAYSAGIIWYSCETWLRNDMITLISCSCIFSYESNSLCTSGCLVFLKGLFFFQVAEVWYSNLMFIRSLDWEHLVLSFTDLLCKFSKVKFLISSIQLCNLQ